MTVIFAVTFVMSAVLICKWTLNHYDDDEGVGFNREVAGSTPDRFHCHVTIVGKFFSHLGFRHHSPGSVI